MGSKRNVGDEVGHGGEEAATDDATDREEERPNNVNISVSHKEIADGLRTLSKMRTNLRVANQVKQHVLKKGNGRIM